ncbi:Sulfotransferase domain-containing protein [Citreimonas salinaria]|uniref:Sulfotransferase domain-containing protein n=1 Tax=Citreimonas salinaria TaxID=321339 RepID=A0A1H3EZB3_9RHOB|nr:Sulfotransferase domain-containing protein [Citreimonas salinaria]
MVEVADTVRFPDLFLIGAPKCGTTSLFSWLRAHPDTFLAIKEPNFLSHDVFDTAGMPGAITSWDEYRAKVCPPEADRLLTGDATPKYLYSQSAFDILAARRDRVRLIAILRNPVDLAIAMHAQNVREGRDPRVDFETAWDQGPLREGDRLTDYHFWGQPGEHLARYAEVFAPDRLKVLILEEEMRQAPARAYAEVLDFLGLAPHQLARYDVANPRLGFRSARLQGGSRRMRRAVVRGLSRLGLNPPATGVLRAMDRLNHSKPGAGAPSAELRQRVADALLDDARKIASTLGRSSLPWDDFRWPEAPDPQRIQEHGA